jgi:molybdopterin-containing oxidoreductase family membrane subunit
MEAFTEWYSGSIYELGALHNRVAGPYAAMFYGTVFCNVLVPQSFWWKRARESQVWLFCASILISIGMWLERFVIVVVSLHRDYLPSSWGMYFPTWVDISLFVGSLGLFGAMFLLFIRFLPAVSVTEVKELRHDLAR